MRATSLLVWWGVPFTLLAFWLRFLVRHDSLITTLHVIVVGISVWLSAMLWRITKDTLRGIAPAQLRWHKTLLSREVFMGVLAGALLALFSAGCFYGKPPNGPWEWRSAAPKLLSFVGWNAFGDLRAADLSRKPDDWDGKDLGAVKGAQLLGRSLRDIDASGAFGPRANFGVADLRRANLYAADLRGAFFTAANLGNTSFSRADLRSATFDLAFTVGAGFEDANIQGADFLRTFGLDARQVSAAGNWFLAHFSPRMLVELKVCKFDKPCDHEDRLRRLDFAGIDLTRFQPFRKADLSGANLQQSSMRGVDLAGSDLSKADLRHADLNGTLLYGVKLTGADLRGADLRTVVGLTRGQIESALTDDKTQLPPYLETQKPFTPKK